MVIRRDYFDSIKEFIKGNFTVDDAKQLIPIIFQTNIDIIEALLEDKEKAEIFLYNLLLNLAKKNELIKRIIIDNLQNVLINKDGYEFSWLMLEGVESNYLVIDLCKQLLEDSSNVGNIKDILLSTILEKEPAIPFDFRGNIIELFMELLKNGKFKFNLKDFKRFREFLLQFNPMGKRTLSNKIEIQTDGVDHLFPIPFKIEQKIEIVRKASFYKVNETIFNDIILILNDIKTICEASLQDEINKTLNDTELKIKREVLESIYDDQKISNDAFKKIEEDVNCKYRFGRDYVHCWDQFLVKSDNFHYNYTIAELLRLCFLTAEFGLPGLPIRKELLKFYRSVLKISGRASIGLKGGVFYVEHGVNANPTIFYMGRGSVMGKSFYIETCGGAVLLSNSYLGGGFIPILIHTHKHIPQKEMSGTSERKNNLRCIFVAEKGARFPMDKSLLFEAANFIGKKTPFTGISVLALGR
jgi:hypothetical protein